MKFLFSAILVVTLSQVYSAPQFISFNDGKLGVNFGGYHAAVGLGGFLGDGPKGGLYAEAGTPFGQSAKAGLGGAAGANGGTTGGLFAGATAGENVHAAAGLAGSINGGKPVGTGFASAQAGNSFSSTSLNGMVSTGHQQLGHNNKQIPTAQNTHQQNPLQTKTEDTNEITPTIDNSIDSTITKPFEITRDTANSNTLSSYIKHNYPSDIKKTIINKQYKPQQSEFQKTTIEGGTIGGTLDTGNISPANIEKKIDIVNENYNKHGISTQSNIKSVDQITYKKETSIGRNPTFFEDIFNIPIAALTAVRTFLTNTAGNTSISLQKSGSLHADTH